MIELVKGVALVVANPGGEILIIEELVSKPHFGKYAGMSSIPMETCHDGESDSVALRRLGTEELPGLVLSPPMYYIGVYRVVPNVWVRLYRTTSPTNNLPGPDSAPDVGNPRWLSTSNAKKLWLRRGALEMIWDYTAGRRQVLRMRFRKVASTRPLMRA